MRAPSPSPAWFGSDVGNSKISRVVSKPPACAARRPYPYKRAMAETTYFPRRLILAGAMVSGVLLALAVHMLGARYRLDLGGLWRSDTSEFMPAGAAIAWWLIATVGFSGGYFTANLMHSAASGQIPQRMRQFLIAVGVLILAGAGQAASAPSPVPTISGVLAGLARAVPRRGDGVLRRAFRAPQSLASFDTTLGGQALPRLRQHHLRHRRPAARLNR